MKKILVLILTLFISSVANADVKEKVLSKLSEKICSKKLLEYSKKDGLSLGKKFKETIEPLGKADGQDIFALFEKFEKAKK